MKNFFFGLDTKVDFGRGKIAGLVNYLKEYNIEKPMIITEKALVDIGIINPLVKALQEGKIKYEICTDVVPDPKVKIINDIGNLVKDKSCDGIIAFGGGSSIDTAKAVAVIARNEGCVSLYLDGQGENKKEITIDPLPIIAVPTTSGTGSEVSVYSVITHNMVKDSITSTKIYPRVAIIDSTFMDKLPRSITANTGLDALGHALEAIINKGENAFTDVLAYEALKLVMENLEVACNEGTSESRDNMAFAALLAGSAMSHCGASIPHAMGCPMSAHLGVPHGLSVGLLQIPMLKYSRKEIEDLIEKIVKYIYRDLYNMEKSECFDFFVNRLSQLMKNIGISGKVKCLGDRENIMEVMRKDAISHGCFPLNRKDITRDEVIEIYESLIK